MSDAENTTVAGAATTIAVVGWTWCMVIPQRFWFQPGHDRGRKIYNTVEHG